MSASADHDGYLVYTSDPGSCNSQPPCTAVYGGTSVSAQVFAGIGALMNQYLVKSGKQSAAGMGNLNAELYPLAQTTSGIFHDITTGNNIVTVSCSTSGRVQTCDNPTVGYNAGPGYDQVTGIGSVDVWNLITGNGTAVAAPPAVSLTLLSNLTSMAATDVTFLIATATGTTGITPVGTVVFTAGTTALGSATLTGSAGVATATLAVKGAQIGLGSLGSQTVEATYNGSSSTVTASLTFSARATSASSGTPSISGTTNAASFSQVYAPGMILAIFGSQLAPSTASASAVPLPLTMAGISATVNGEAAPLWYVSSGQFNIQIPYETAVGPATLEINNNGQIISRSFTVAAAAPGIFTDSSGNIANGLAPVGPGQETVLYLTGAGALTPALATGAAPAVGTPQSQLPAPTQPTAITVGGVPVSTPFPFIGVTVSEVLLQINFTVPSSVPAGRQPVVVTVGGVPSLTAYLTVN